MARPTVKLFLAGDVMIGRGIDQVLPHPCPPPIYESCCRSALDYVALAERANGPLPRPVPFDYPWGDALSELAFQAPNARVVNLETAVTLSERPWPGKGINYRVSPKNAACLKSLGADCCVLANNHTLDWGYEGLAESLDTLQRLHVATAGAGLNDSEARAPAAIGLPHGGRLLVFAWGEESAGVPRSWQASPYRAGVNILRDHSDATVEEVRAQVLRHKRPDDIAMASIHWGSNWSFDISAEERNFARRLIDEAGIDLLHGHSSHHVRGIEAYNNKLIIYGCGDWLNDYEGIGGYEDYRSDLALMYFPTLDAETGALVDLTMTPTTVRRMQVKRVPEAGDIAWLRNVLNYQGGPGGRGVTVTAEGRLRLHQDEAPHAL